MGFNLPALLRRRGGNFPLGVPRGASTVLNFASDAYLVGGSRFPFTSIPGATVSGGVDGTVERFVPAAGETPAHVQVVPATEQNLFIYSEDLTNAAWVKTSVTVEEAYNNLYKVTASAGSSVKRITQNGSPTGVQSFSFVAKADTHNFIQALYGRSADAYVNFDLSSGTVGFEGSDASGSITDLGDGLYLCNVVFNDDFSYSTSYRIYLVSSASAAYNEGFNADGTEAVLLGRPQLRLAQYSDTYVPTTDAAITRAAPRITDLTRVRKNLLTHSDPSNDDGWTNVSGATTGASSGSFDLALITGGGTTSSRRQSDSFTVSAEAEHTLQVKLKAGTSPLSHVRVFDGAVSSENGGIVVDWSDGVASVNSETGNASGAKIEALGGGVYLLSFQVATAVGQTDARVLLYPDVTGSGDRTVMAGQVQLETGSVATDYIPTTSSARSVVEKTGSGLLVEGEATNLLTWSEDLTNEDWSKVGAGNGVAPVITTQDEFQTVVFNAPASGDQSVILQDNSNDITQGASYAGSIDLRAARPEDVGKTVLFRHVARASYVEHTLTAEWVRHSNSETAANSNSFFEIGLRPQFGNTSGEVSVDLRRPQLEPGTTATSYIPTEGSAVTRTADSITLTDLDALGLTPPVLGQLEPVLDLNFNADFSGGTIPDRSNGGNDATVNGTLTAEPVAEGAELLALSGFDADDYLEVSGADIEMGNGDFALAAWIKPVSGTSQTIFCYDTDGGATAERYYFLIDSGDELNLTIEDGTTTDFCEGARPANGSWQQAFAVRRGNTLEIYLDGQLVETAQTTVGSVDNANGVLAIGKNPSNAFTANWLGSIALPRVIKGYAPTAAEIARIYNDELPLFQAGATGTELSALHDGGYTVVVEGEDGTGYGESNGIIQISDGTTNNRVFLGLRATSKISHSIKVSNVEQLSSFDSGDVLPANQPVKYAARIATNDSAFARNGTVTLTDTSVTLPSALSQITLGLDAAILSSHRLTIIPRAVSDAELQALSS